LIIPVVVDCPVALVNVAIGRVGPTAVAAVVWLCHYEAAANACMFVAIIQLLLLTGNVIYGTACCL
jgi:hypothetical protein